MVGFSEEGIFGRYEDEELSDIDPDIEGDEIVDLEEEFAPIIRDAVFTLKEDEVVAVLKGTEILFYEDPSIEKTGDDLVREILDGIQDSDEDCGGIRIQKIKIADLCRLAEIENGLERKITKSVQILVLNRETGRWQIAETIDTTNFKCEKETLGFLLHRRKKAGFSATYNREIHISPIEEVHPDDIN